MDKVRTPTAKIAFHQQRDRQREKHDRGDKVEPADPARLQRFVGLAIGQSGRPGGREGDRKPSRENRAHVPGNDTPAVLVRSPDPRISKRSGKRCSLECPAHLHAHAHHSDVAKSLDALLARLESGDTDQTALVRVQIILFSVERTIRPGEDEHVVHEPVELLHITCELRLPERCLARV